MPWRAVGGRDDRGEHHRLFEGPTCAAARIKLSHPEAASARRGFGDTACETKASFGATERADEVPDLCPNLEICGQKLAALREEEFGNARNGELDHNLTKFTTGLRLSAPKKET